MVISNINKSKVYIENIKLDMALSNLSLLCKHKL